MTDFTPDFGGASQGYEAAAGPLFLGLDPLLLTLLLALIGIAGFVGWVLGRRDRSGDDPEAVAKAIHARILAAAKDAKSAESDRLVEKSRALKALVTELLGNVIAVGGGVSPALKGIQDALDHKRPPAKGAAAAPATQVPLINVTVNAAPPSPPPPPPGDLTGPEQIAHLDAAVRQFHDHWARSADRISEIKSAQDQLSRKPPEAPHTAREAGGPGDAAHLASGASPASDDGHGPAVDPVAERRPIWERGKKKKKSG